MDINKVLISIAQVLFAVFCIFVSVGMPSGIGRILMIITAVIAIPIPIINKFLGLKSTGIKELIRLFIIVLLFMAAAFLGAKAEGAF